MKLVNVVTLLNVTRYYRLSVITVPVYSSSSTASQNNVYCAVVMALPESAGRTTYTTQRSPP